jgi:hypothetical protein
VFGRRADDLNEDKDFWRHHFENDCEEKGLNINGEYLHHIRFADVIVLLSEKHTELQDILNQLDAESLKAGLTMNTINTKILTSGVKEEIKLKGERVDYDEYEYLGQTISSTIQMEKEISKRISTSWIRFWSLKEILKNKEIPMTVKGEIINTCITPCLSYGSQTWSLTNNHIKKLEVCQNSMPSALSIPDVKRKDRVRLS